MWKTVPNAREDARRTAGRPITVAQAVAFASCLGVAGALFGATSAWFQGWIATLTGSMKQLFATITLPSLPTISVPASFATVIAEHAVIGVTVLVFLVLAPVTVFWVTRERP